MDTVSDEPNDPCKPGQTNRSLFSLLTCCWYQGSHEYVITSVPFKPHMKTEAGFGSSPSLNQRYLACSSVHSCAEPVSEAENKRKGVCLSIDRHDMICWFNLKP